MALNATMYRFSIDLSDMDRSIYQSLTLHVALHPSETLQRMAMRLMAYCLNYDEHLEFTKGLSTDAEPDLWQKSYSDEIEHWIELGLPDPKRLKKACGRSRQVTVYAYGGQAVEAWWHSVENTLARQDGFSVYRFDEEAITAFSAQIERGMSLSCLVQDGSINLSWQDQMLEIQVAKLA